MHLTTVSSTYINISIENMTVYVLPCWDERVIILRSITLETLLIKLNTRWGRNLLVIRTALRIQSVK